MPRGSLENLPDTFPSLGTAFDITLSANLLRDSKTLGALDGTLVHTGQVLVRLGVLPEIFLAGDKNNGEALAEVEDFRDPLRRMLARTPWEAS